MWRKEFIEKYASSNEGKFNTYSSFKDKFVYENYLEDVTNFNHRRALTKLRISNHCLNIEVGRYKKPPIPREERLCTFCLANNIKSLHNEAHFILICPAHDDIRSKTIDSYIFNICNFDKLSESSKFFYLMTSEDQTVRAVAKFCYDAFVSIQS